VIDNLLANAGFETRTSSAGDAALDLLQMQDYDLVLLADHLVDLSLNGFLKTLHTFPTQPVVILMQSEAPRSWELGPYRAMGASGAVNKWRPCEVLGAAIEVLAAARANEG